MPLPWYLGGNQLEAIHDSYHQLLAYFKHTVWCSQVPLVPDSERVAVRDKRYFELRHSQPNKESYDSVSVTSELNKYKHYQNLGVNPPVASQQAGKGPPMAVMRVIRSDSAHAGPAGDSP